MTQRDHQPFVRDALRPALALIRIPSNPHARTQGPTPGDAFGTGFFVKKNGVLVTVAHNVTELNKLGEPDPAGTPLPWVWVCCYSARDLDWTDAYRVDVVPSLIDATLDAAILRVSVTRAVSTVPVGAEWGRGDEVVVLGFQPNSDKKSGYELRSMLCTIPREWDVAPFDLSDSDEPTLRLGFLAGDRSMGTGMSGGPVLNGSGTRVIAVEKGIDWTEMSELCYLRCLLFRNGFRRSLARTLTAAV